MGRAFLLGLALLGLVGCAAGAPFGRVETAPSAEPPPPAGASDASPTPPTTPAPSAEPVTPEEPEWLVRDRAREATLEGSHSVAASDGWFVASVPAKPEPASVPFEDGVDYAFDFDLAADVSITCRVLRTAGSPAELLRATSLGMFESVGRAVGPVSARRIERIVAGAIGAAPFMGIDWLFVARTQDGEATNGLALRHAVKDEAGILCMKLGIGYGETLRTIFESLVGSFARVDPPPPAVFEEVVVASLSGRPVGVGRRVVRRDDEGDLRDELLLHVLTPVAPDRTSAFTNQRYEWVDGRDLRLLNAGMASFRDGEEQSSLTLESAGDDGPLVIRGHRAGEPVERVLAGEPELESQLAAIARTRAALSRPDPTAEPLSSRVWSEVAPLRISEATLRITELVDAQRARGVATVGRSVVEVLIERATGQTLSASYDVEGTSITVERVFARGTP